MQLNMLSLLLLIKNKETHLPLADRTHTLVGCLILHELKCYSFSLREKYD